MSKIALMIDANSGIDEVNEQNDVFVVRSGIHFGNENFRDGLTMNSLQFYEKLSENDDLIPSTSMPPIGEVIELIEKLIEEGYTDLIHFPISYALSGTGPAIEALSAEYKDQINIVVFDTKAAAYPQARFGLIADKMVKQGKTVDEILKEMHRIRDNSHAYFVVQDLRYLVKNGRLSGASGFVGNMLKIKPLLELTDEGKIESIEKIRTTKKAIQRLIEKVIDETSKYSDVTYVILHGNVPEEAKDLEVKLREAREIKEEIKHMLIAPAVGAHVGAGILGIAYFIN